MSTTCTPVLFEFRCNRCWQSNILDCEQAGALVECQVCAAELIAPDATPERIARAESLAKERAYVPSPEPKSPIARGNKERLVDHFALEEELVGTHGTRRNFDAAPASPESRILAHLIDGTCDTLAILFGILVLSLLIKYGRIDDPREQLQYQAPMAATTVILFSVLFVTLKITQWVLLTYRGQTIGKTLLCIRVVKMDGSLPGFFQGVVLRCWGRALLGVIPFFGVIELALLFTQSRRTVHDWISITRVVEAH